MKLFFMSIYFIAFVGFAFLIGLGCKERDLFKSLIELTLGVGGLIELIFLIFMGRAYDAAAEVAACEIYDDDHGIQQETIIKYHSLVDNNATTSTRSGGMTTEEFLNELIREERRSRDESEAWYFRW